MKSHVDVKDDKITITTDKATFVITEDGIDIKATTEITIKAEKVELDKPVPVKNALQRLPLPSVVKKVLS